MTRIRSKEEYVAQSATENELRRKVKIKLMRLESISGSMNTERLMSLDAMLEVAMMKTAGEARDEIERFALHLLTAIHRNPLDEYDEYMDDSQVIAYVIRIRPPMAEILRSMESVGWPPPAGHEVSGEGYARGGEGE